MRDLEGITASREGYIQEGIARSLVGERDLWRREREAYVVATKREREREREREKEREGGQLQVEISLLRGNIGVLISEIRGHRMPLPFSPHIPSKNPPIC